MARTWTLSAKTSDRLKREIEKYLTILRPISDPKTGGIIDLAEMDKPASSAPTTSKFEHLMCLPENRAAALRLEYILNEMASQPGIREFVYVQCLSAAGPGQDNPSLLRTWRAGATDDARLLAGVFDEALECVAQKYQEYFGGDLKVVISDTDEPADSHRHVQRRGKAHADALLVDKLEAIERDEGPITRAAAIGLLMDREKTGYWRIRDAIRKVNKLRESEAENGAS